MFCGEDHTNFQTLVAFLTMLSVLVRSSLWINPFSYCFHCVFINICCRPLVKKGLQKFMIYLGVKHFALLVGKLYLTVYQYMKKGLDSLFRVVVHCCQNFRKEMQRH